MDKDIFPESNIPVRRSKDLLPEIFKTESNNKFLGGLVDPLIQPGVLDKKVGYVGRRYGKTFRSSDVYLDNDQTLRSRYQLEPGVIVRNDVNVEGFYDYIDFKNQLKFFGNIEERDDLITSQHHYTWNPPIDWDKLINYREYFWVPDGPPGVRIQGQSQKIVSTYRVTLGANSYIFSPDGQTNNPTITLYRGQTYKFNLNVPGDFFVIRSNIDTGSLTYNPIVGYQKGQIVLYGNNLYQAQGNVPIAGLNAPLDTTSGIWKLLENLQEQKQALDYDQGVVNNRSEKGTVIFDVPFDAPDTLFYQSLTDPNKFGKFVIDSVENNTKIDVSNEILGKADYLSSNGVQLSNGMILRFEGLVTPVKYASGSWLVEGVGEEITLTKFSDLSVSQLLSTISPEILFDDGGFDTAPFDDAAAYPAAKDYITISKSSKDSNPWSRYNRWFHRSVLEYSHNFNNSNFDSPESARAKRPIIEFKPNLQLFNHGAVAKQSVDYVDDFTTDVFSSIEGAVGYNIDNEELFEGARLLITADTDRLVNNKIYTVRFITHNNRRQISLIPTEDSETAPGECVLVQRGLTNKGLMFNFDGTRWNKSQLKTTINQAPLFDLFDENEISFSNAETYPVSSFAGSKLVSYKTGVGPNDSELGFPISYLNIDNVGDIQFDNNFEQDIFTYKINRVTFSKKLSLGYFKLNLVSGTQYSNGWIPLDNTFVQPIIETVVAEDSNTIECDIIDWDAVSDEQIKKLVIYKNGIRYDVPYTRTVNQFVFEKDFVKGDSVTFRLYADFDPKFGYYEIPIGLERNPLNNEIDTFTLGQVNDHLLSALDLFDDFEGIYPGQNNLRDISGYQPLCRRFVKHSGLSPLAILLLCDKQVNIIKSIQYSRREYTDFKNNFIKLSDERYTGQTVVELVDEILEEMGRARSAANSFSNSDMVGSGAYTTIEYQVEDEGIKTFALSSKFDLNTLSNKAVYVYINGQQILHGRDYEFNSIFGFVNIKASVIEGDKIEIREYVTTGSSFIPPTPTKLGLYKKYTPRKFLDDTYRIPKEVIQGHDGSITIAYGDFRDDVLLELEHRIYNNIKQEYDETLFDIDAVLGGYYDTGLFNKKQVDNIVNRDFLSWISGTTTDYVNNIYFDSEDSYTYTYSNMTNIEGTKALPGYWRGVYQWYYDTDRPHRCPWEMLGFSEKPDWWEEQYGAAPYTSGNLLLWEDIRDGIIRQGARSGTYPRYQRPSILSHLPVDGDGNLLSPLDSGLAANFSLINNQGRFFLGDVSPAEYAWRSSSEWPYSILTVLCLLKPFEFLTDNFIKSSVRNNKLGQTVDKTSGLFTRIEDITRDDFDHLKSSGLCRFVIDYLKGTSTPTSILADKISRLDVNLSYRMSGFVDQQQQKFILDSKNPKSQSSSIFIPVENYDIIFNVSSPIGSITYSGVIVEKIDRGFKMSGYDALDPFFEYYQPVASQQDPLISIGGVSENFVEWNAEKFYNNGVVCRYNSNFYRALKSHTSGDTFDLSAWKQLPALPKVGSIDAFKRKNFNKTKTKILVYGEILPDVQSVVDFFLGYEEFLKSKGLVFDGYNIETQSPKDWFTSVKEFMYWTKHNWDVGSLITFSPIADRIEFNIQIGVADNLLDSFYGYQVLKNDGLPLRPEFINVTRDFQKLVVSTTNTNNGIYFFKGHLVLKEHVTVFDDRTVFNDVIYDKPTGYRQERIKSRGFRTVDWDGDYTSPGFLFDNVNIDVWQPFTDYKLGDIVAYKSFYWTSQTNQLGSEEFNDTLWTKLDSTPQKGLISNFDYRINQFEDYYEADADGIGSSQRDLSRHLIGYQSRDYLQQLAEDQVSQFKLYQGFIREKGTANAIVKVFDKLSESSDDSIVLNEEWAFQVGNFGGTDQTTRFEFEIKKDEFEINPQPIFITLSESTGPEVDQYVRIPFSKFTLSPNPFTTNLNPVSEYDKLNRSAGYVSFNDVDYTIKNRDDLLNFDINTVKENSLFWVTFDLNSWTVIKYNEPPTLRIISVSAVDEANKIARITFNSLHTIAVDDIIGIRDVSELTGFRKVVARGKTYVDVKYTAVKPEMEDSTSAAVGIFSDVRYTSYDDIDEEYIAASGSGTKFWIDDNSTGKWTVIEKVRQYSNIDLVNYGVTNPIGLGSAVVYIENLKQVVANLTASGYVLVYTESTDSMRLRQIISPPSGFEAALLGCFGEVLTVSPDYRFLVIGSPLASGVNSRFRGNLRLDVQYVPDDIVFYQDKTWKAVNDIPSYDGSSIDFASEDWTPATIIEAVSNGVGTGFAEQGMVSVYRYADNRWENTVNILSPRPSQGEHFGSDISIGVSGSTYYMAVSAKDSMGGKGRVYLFYYTGTEWKQLENPNYAGIYSTVEAVPYPIGTIVWDEDFLWEATANQQGAATKPSDSVSGWKKLDPVSTDCSLPNIISVADDDGSTLMSGILTADQLAEAVKEGDQFGFETAMNYDGSILVVGTPNSDGQFYNNYKGLYKSYQEYKHGDVVKSDDNYYRLGSPDSTVDSTNAIKGVDPASGEPWFNITDSTPTGRTGKIYIYKRTGSLFLLKQIITADNLADYSDLPAGDTIEIGDLFGYSVDIDPSGATIAASAPRADLGGQTQGVVYIFETASTESIEYRLKQKIQSFEEYNNEFFGSKIRISPGLEKIVVGAKNAGYTLITGFEAGTTFDRNKTRFSDSQGYPGQVYVYENKAGKYLLTEKLETDFVRNESFGYTLDCTRSTIVVGSPNYKLDNERVGKVRLFRKVSGSSSLKTLATQQPLINIDLLKNIELYNIDDHTRIAELDIVDHFKLKILNVAEQELSFKVPYDPAFYDKGTEEVTVDASQPWYEKNVGKLWWDLSTVKFNYYEQGDDAYKIGYWNSQSIGSSVDVYEWIESVLLPSEWSILADTTEGLAEGISGQPKYPNNSVYNTKQIFNPNTGQEVGTKYYYWVKNKTTLPSFELGRRMPAASVADMINNPIGSNIPFISIIAADKFLAYNIRNILTTDRTLLNVEYNKDPSKLNLAHNEYQLLTEGVSSSNPTEYLERKWIDSLIGFDEAGNSVPDPKLAENQKYGLRFRPRQSMFVDRIKAIKIVIDRANNILASKPFSDLIDLSNFNSKDPLPSKPLNAFDFEVDDYVDLLQVGVVRVKQAVFRANIINGKIDTIDIVDPGFGYRNAPFIEIEGTGSGATAEITVDAQGRVNSITVTNKGRKYTFANIKIRPFSVQVISDSTADGRWSIYSWDQQRKIFYRSKSQAYDVSRYWYYIDWWKDGYDEDSRIVKEINNFYEESYYIIKEGDLLRVKEYASGGWAVFKKTAPGQGEVSGDYQLVGRQNGTLQISSSVYDTSSAAIGFDNVGTFDSDLYDLQPARELRILLKAIKEDLCVEDLAVEWNNMFFASIRYSYSEQDFIDWAFKTSFVSAVHNVGPLSQPVNYTNDNLLAYQTYIEEVKPFRTTIREYTSRYTKIEGTGSAVSDFDLPADYSTAAELILPIRGSFDKTGQYPWQYWYDNNGYSIVRIDVSDAGGDYTNPPKVLIEGDGTGATARAFVSSQRVSGIEVLTAGEGYKTTPTIYLVGGNGTSTRIAKAVAILGDTKVRSFNVGMKFDRISKSGIFQNFQQTQTFVATGLTSVFDLNYPPTRNKDRISIKKNNQTVLNSDYNISLFSVYNDAYTVPKGRLIFNSSPIAGDVIEITYDKNTLILDSVNRIDRFYAPMPGMKGKEKNQLMTGIDFGGVQIQGTTFDVTGGWDALPWYVDSWDSVESSADYYYIADGSTTFIVLPFTPKEGEIWTIYLKRLSESRPTRIDDPYWGKYDGSTVQPNGRVTAPKNARMPTIIGDGSTNVVELRDSVTDLAYVEVDAGDTLIFRPVESDGSVVITDVNLLDTRISGGSLSAAAGAYQTATGLTPEEIIISGDKFISPDQVPAPEENVPGQILDSLSIKVFNLTNEAGIPLQSKVVRSDGNTLRYDIGLKVIENNSVAVYVNKIKQEQNVDYEVDLATDTVLFLYQTNDGDLIEIVSIGIGGVGILDYQEFTADGDTNLFLTNSLFNQTDAIFVTVNGEQFDVEFIDSSTVIDRQNRTMVQFGTPPAPQSIIKILTFGFHDTDVFGDAPLIRINQQIFFFDGSTNSFSLDNFVDLNRNSKEAPVLVEINGSALQGLDTTYIIYDGTNNEITVGIDPEESIGAITSGELKIYVNNELKRFVLDYVYNGNANQVIIPPSNLVVGDIIKIENSFRSKYNINQGNLTIAPEVFNNLQRNDDSTLKDVIKITWFSEYPSLDLIADEYTGGKVQYKLPRNPLAIDYVWVYKNGIRLTQDKDYTLSLPRGVLYLVNGSSNADIIKIIIFGNRPYRSPRAFEIFKDMLNNVHYKRYSRNKDIKLSKDLTYFADQIEVTDGSLLADPIPNRKIPGVVSINNERIEYFEKIGNILSKLRRGSLGTAIAELHSVGSFVVDVGATETLPYAESQERIDFTTASTINLIPDGTSRTFENLEDLYLGYGNKRDISVKINGDLVNPDYYLVDTDLGTLRFVDPIQLAETDIVTVTPLLVGPLDFVPLERRDSQGNSLEFSYKETIPDNYYPCDQFEVFKSGTRLRKNPIAVYQEELGLTSPQADINLEAEFSVDGSAAYIRLTEEAAPGTRITVIRRQGNLWYERGENTASRGITLLENTTPIAEFIFQKGSELPE